MQAEMEQRLQNQMQSQLRQAQLQLQQVQQQTQLLQRQALQAQAKATQEAEARKRAEEEVRRAAAMAIANKPLMGQPKRVSWILLRTWCKPKLNEHWLQSKSQSVFLEVVVCE